MRKLLYLGLLVPLLISGCNEHGGSSYSSPNSGDTTITPIEVPNDTRVYRSTVTIDSTSTQTEISPFIYGQFIEHIDRCIYEGLWAEMLLDRKFYFDVNDYRTQWIKSGNVTMVTDNPFVGDHDVRIGDNSYILQRKLTVEENVDYVGYIYLKTDEGNPTIEISFNFNDDEIINITPTGEYQKYEFTIKSLYNLGNANIKITSKGGAVRVGTISLMRADNINGMRKDTIEMLRILNSPIYRWPGGNFVSGYNWKDGIGDRDKRAPKRNMEYGKNEAEDSLTIANMGFSSLIEPNDFGLDEFLLFCKLVNAEPFIVVNTGLGTIQDAVDEVKYTNAKINGQDNPKYVKWWAVGNEMYGEWQQGYIPPYDYAQRHNAFARAMLEVDPNIELVAVGETNKSFSKMMYEECADYMTHISEHIYWPHQDSHLANADALKNFIKDKINIHRNLRKTVSTIKNRNIMIAFDEYAYMNATSPSALRDGLGVANALNEFIRNSDIVIMANYSSTINTTQGSITTTPTDVMLQGSGVALTLYRNYFGKFPYKVSNSNGVIDVVAALDDDGYLTVAITNASERYYYIDIKGFEIISLVDAHVMEGDDPYSINSSGDMEDIRLVQKGTVDLSKNSVLSAPLTSTIYKLNVKKA